MTNDTSCAVLKKLQSRSLPALRLPLNEEDGQYAWFELGLDRSCIDSPAFEDPDPQRETFLLPAADVRLAGSRAAGVF